MKPEAYKKYRKALEHPRTIKEYREALRVEKTGSRDYRAMLDGRDEELKRLRPLLEQYKALAERDAVALEQAKTERARAERRIAGLTYALGLAEHHQRHLSKIIDAAPEQTGYRFNDETGKWESVNAPELALAV